MKKLKHSLLILAIIVLIEMIGCKPKVHEIISVHFDSIYVDTSLKYGMFVDIKPIVKTYDSIEKVVDTIKGFIQIPEIKDHEAKEKGIRVDVYLKKKRKYMKVDTDRDGSLLDENEYEVTEKSQLVSFPDVEISDKNKKINMTLYVVPMESGLFKPKSEYDMSAIGVRYLYIRKAGTLSLKNRYSIMVSNDFDGKFSSNGASIYDPKNESKVKKEIRYKIGDILHLDRNELLLKEIDLNGDKIIFEKIGIENKQYGYMDGDYALPVLGKDIITNNVIELKDEPGKLTLLEFWGTWCGPCVSLTPEYVKLQKKYIKNLKIIGIASDSTEAIVKKYLLKKEVNYLNIFDNINGEICEKFVVRSFPTFILIDSDGKIIFRGAGFDYFEEVKGIIIKRIINISEIKNL